MSPCVIEGMRWGKEGETQVSTMEGHSVLLEGHNVEDGVWCCISEIWGQKVMGRAPISQEPFKGPPFSVFGQTQPLIISTGWRTSILDTKGPVFEGRLQAGPWIGLGLGFLQERPI